MTPPFDSDIDQIQQQISSLRKDIVELSARVLTLDHKTTSISDELRPIGDKLSSILQNNATTTETIANIRDDIKEQNQRQTRFDEITDKLREDLKLSAELHNQVARQQQKNIARMEGFNKAREDLKLIGASQAERIQYHNDCIRELDTKVKEMNEGVTNFLTHIKLLRRVVYGIGGIITALASIQAMGGFDVLRKYFSF